MKIKLPLLKHLLLVGILMFAFRAQSAVQVGSGFNSATGGRLIPSFNLGVGGEAFDFLASSTGVSTKTYFHSAYTLGVYRTWRAGEFGPGGSIVTGFGFGALYAVRGYQATGAERETKSDYVLGPSFFGRWSFWGPLFLAVEGIYGLFGPSSNVGDVITLNARDHVNLIIGVRL